MTAGNERPWSSQDEKGPIFSFVDLDNIRLGLEQFLERKRVPRDRHRVFSIKNLISAFYSDRAFIYGAIDGKSAEEELIQSLRSERGFIFKSAKLTINGSRRKQQGVDVLMAIDALKHAHSKNMASCNIFSGDGDFLPLIEALVDNGVMVSTISFGDPVHSEVASSLRDASDMFYQIGSRILLYAMETEFSFSSSGSCDKETLLRGATEIETCFPELEGRVLKQTDERICLIDERTPLNNLSKSDTVRYMSFRSQVGLEEWYRISRQS